MTLDRADRAEQVLDFCARAPVERVFLEDVARRGLGRFAAVEGRRGALAALCHVGANLVPSGEGCEAFADAAAQGASRMIIGEARRGGDPLGGGARPSAGAARGPSGPAGLRDHRAARSRAAPACGRRRAPTSIRSVPACAAAHELELGIDPLQRDPEAFPLAHRRLRSTRDARGSGSRTTSCSSRPRRPRGRRARCRSSRSGSTRRRAAAGTRSRGLRDLCRLLLETTPTVTLFVRRDNAPAIALYESIGMSKALEYRSVLF